MNMEDLEFVTVNNLNSEQKASMKAFCCGKEKSHEEINSYLINESSDDHKYNITKTYLVFSNEILLGYFSLSSDRVSIVKTSNMLGIFKRDGNKVKKNSVPSVTIHHFAINENFQGKYIGKTIMYQVFYLILQNIVPFLGACIITTYSLHSAVPFYKAIGFEKLGQQTRDNANVCMGFYINEFVEEIDTFKESGNNHE